MDSPMTQKSGYSLASTQDSSPGLTCQSCQRKFGRFAMGSAKWVKCLFWGIQVCPDCVNTQWVHSSTGQLEPICDKCKPDFVAPDVAPRELNQQEQKQQAVLDELNSKIVAETANYERERAARMAVEQKIEDSKNRSQMDIDELIKSIDDVRGENVLLKAKNKDLRDQLYRLERSVNRSLQEADDQRHEVEQKVHTADMDNQKALLLKKQLQDINEDSGRLRKQLTVLNSVRPKKSLARELDETSIVYGSATHEKSCNCIIF